MKSFKASLKKLGSYVPSKKRSQTYNILVFMGVFALIGSIFLFKSFAATPQLYLTPATGTVQTGSDYTVTLRADSGGTADTVDATITYDQSKLRFKSIDGTASPFNTAIVETGANGTVQVTRARITSPASSVSGDAEVTKVTFTAISTAAGSTNLTVAGEVYLAGATITTTKVGASVNITVPPVVTHTASYTIENSTTTPVVGTPFGLKVYVTSDANIQGGEVVVNLPATMAYQGTLDTTGTAFNPATTVTGTTSQLVHLVFVTQATNLTGKQLVATIPVLATTAGSQNVSFTGARVVDTASADITPVTATQVAVLVGSPIAKPIVTMPGKAQLAATENITLYNQSFTITNFDAAAAYTVTMGGQTLGLSSNSFSIPANLKNGDYTLMVGISKSGTGDSSSYTIRLRSPNVNRTTCIDLLDLLAVNKAYGQVSAEFDLNFDGTVGLIDLLTVTGNWGTVCIP